MIHSYCKTLVSILLLVEASAVKEVRFASPLQSLTIPDPELLETASSEDGQAALATRRRRFLPRFRFGLEVENLVRQKLAIGELSVDDDDDDDVQVEVGGKDWVGKTKALEERRRGKEAALIEKGYDAAMAKYDLLPKSKLPTKKNPNKYQMVGLVDKRNPKNPIQWHARPKPEGAKWSVRLVHINKDVIVKDLFDQGKIDIFAKYTNTGKMQTKGEGDSLQQTNMPIVTREYEARERSWK